MNRAYREGTWFVTSPVEQVIELLLKMIQDPEHDSHRDDYMILIHVLRDRSEVEVKQAKKLWCKPGYEDKIGHAINIIENDLSSLIVKITKEPE